MKIQTVLSLAVVALALTACRGGSSGGGGDYVAGPASNYDVAWDQGYTEVQQTSRASKTYELLDYTRTLYFDGNSTIAQTQQRIALILQSSRAVRISTEQVNRFVVLATDARPQYRNKTSKQLLTNRRRR